VPVSSIQRIKAKCPCLVKIYKSAICLAMTIIENGRVTDLRTNAPSSWMRALDGSLYSLDDEEKEFMKTTTGIEDDEELKKHILATRQVAYEVIIGVSSFSKPT
jgi:hypothetical protein